MLKVGLTGNLCSGYEDVSVQFKKLGVPVFDADVVSKFMIHYDEVISKEIRIRFGDVAFQNGFLNEKTFNSTEKLELLLKSIHKKLLQSWEKFRLKHKDEPYVIFKYALLYEREIDSSMNFTVNTFAPKDERIYRYIDQEGASYTEAYSVIENGPDDLQKNKLATYIVHNYRDASVNLEQQVKHIHQKINEKVEPKRFDSEVCTLYKNIFT